MATAVKNIAGLALAPLGAFNAPIISSNVQTIHVLGTTGAQINTYPMTEGFNLVLSVPSSNGWNAYQGKNFIAILQGSNDPDTIITLGYDAISSTTDGGFVPYTVNTAFDRSCPLVMFIPMFDAIGTVTLQITNSLSGSATAMVRTLVYPD